MINSLRKRLKAFREDKRGTASIEFAVTILPVITALIGVFETTWMLAVSADMSRASADVVRIIRTGSINAASSSVPGKAMTAGEFRNYFCDHLWIVSCANANISIDLKVMDTIGEAESKATNPLKPVDVAAYDDDPSAYKGPWELDTSMDVDFSSPGASYGNRATESGATGSVILVRVYGEFPGLARLWNPGLAHTADGRTILQVSQLFTNEP